MSTEPRVGSGWSSTRFSPISLIFRRSVLAPDPGEPVSVRSRPTGPAPSLAGMDRAFQERARARAAVTSSGIGAAFERNTSPPDLDGVQWRIWISDGQGVGAIDTELSASEQIFGYE